MICERIFGECGTARAHHPVADLHSLGLGTDLGDLTGPLHAEHGAEAPGAAMRMALGHAEVGPVEAAGAHFDQHLRAFRCGFGDVGDFGAVGAVDIGFHEIVLGWKGRGKPPYSAAWRREPDSMPSSRLRMMVSASRMMRETSSAQLGMS